MAAPECWLAEDAVHAHADDIEARTVEWAAGLGLASSRFERGRVARLAARVMPEAPVEMVELAARWASWFFLVDDWVDRGGTVASVSRLAVRVRAVTGQRLVRPSNRRLEIALDQLWRQTRAVALSPEWLRRFGQGLRDYVAALVWERRLAQRRQIPGWGEYMSLRPVANGMFLWDLVELGTGEEVDVELWLWRSLRQASNEITAWRNDLVSVWDEVQVGDVDNAVLVLEQLYDGVRDEALTTVERLIAQRIRDVGQYESALLASGAQQTKTARAWARVVPAGHARWVIDSGRYSDPTSIH